MIPFCARIGPDETSTRSERLDENDPADLRYSDSCDTLPLFTGGLRGSFRFFVYVWLAGQRFSSTAVYAPCQRTFLGHLDACAYGHGAYTA